MTQVVSSPSPAIELVPFAEAHLPEAQGQSQAVQWPHRIEDWKLHLAISQGVAAVADGRVMGTALCSLFGPVAAVNMIIADAAMRGRGLGRRLMEHVITLARDREMRLVAPQDGLPLYRKLGFEDCGHVVQLQGTACAATPELPVTFAPANLHKLAEMDTEASGMARGPLLSRIADSGETLTTTGGFAILRRFGKGHVLGPVVARDATAARSLIAAGVNHMQGRFLRIDLIEERGLVPFVEELGLTVVGGGTSMVRNPKARTDGDYQTHAMISQAHG
ncbi:GNAT superfamily N-acetyltransferase [Sagittula marina]|uniref:GNAT superfamily N-acetyltransferase n=1 Tax=Sagittula marina TaxID=943940 RepID=A0A7W6DQ87_9RHOB|nr:GNAT family N-acetyltransferase [Sagittula marina]MBB3984957.1 GNAT superfamily N-acetyltransferase [Sagittula marina]